MMKKKVLIATTVLSIALAGVVSAASIWGTYKGNDIIRLTVGGNPIKVSDVPAISYNNRTMIPIYLLKQAGIDYTWDQTNKTVDIVPLASKIETVETGVDYFNVYKRLSKYNVNYISQEAGIYNGTPTNHVMVTMSILSNGLTDTALGDILIELAKANAEYLFIGFSDNSFYAIKYSDIRLWLNGSITGSQLAGRMVYNQ